MPWVVGKPASCPGLRPCSVCDRTVFPVVGEELRHCLTANASLFEAAPGQWWTAPCLWCIHRFNRNAIRRWRLAINAASTGPRWYWRAIHTGEQLLRELREDRVDGWPLPHRVGAWLHPYIFELKGSPTSKRERDVAIRSITMDGASYSGRPGKITPQYVFLLEQSPPRGHGTFHRHEDPD